MFSSSRASASASQEGAFAKTFLAKPFVPELKPLRVEDFGISKEAQKKVNIDPNRTCENLNTAWQSQWVAEKERIETAYKQAVVFDEMTDVFQTVQKDIVLLGGKGGGIWAQRTAQVTCVEGGTPSNSYVEVTCQNGVPFGVYSLDIREIVLEQTSGLSPITVPSLQEFCSWPQGTLIINGKRITFLEKMSLENVMFSINQMGRGIFRVTHFVVKQPTPTEEGVFQLAFQSLDPAIALVFDDDCEGAILQRLGFVDSPEVPSGSRIVINGVEIQRPANLISDIIPGVTLRLLQQTPASRGNFLRIVIQSPEELLQKKLDDLAQQIRQFHRLVTLHVPAEPQIEGLLKDFFFLRRLDQDFPLFFMRGFGPPDCTGRQKTAGDFGFELFDRQVVFNPEGLKKALASPEICRNFFLQTHAISCENIGIIRTPPSFSGLVTLWLLRENDEDKFFLQAAGGVRVQGVVQGTTLRGPRGHPLQDFFLFFNDIVRQEMDAGETIEADLEITAGFSDSFLTVVSRYEREFEQARLMLQENLRKSQEKMSRVQVAIEKKRKELRTKSVDFQRAFVVASLQEKFQKDLFKQMFSDT